MINEPNVIKIRELPEKDNFTRDDYLPVQDNNDTWRVKADVLNRYIDTSLYPLQQSVILQQQSITELRDQLIEEDQKRTETIEYMKDLMLLRYKTHGTSQKSYSDINAAYRVCNIGSIKIDPPADETDLPIPTIYSALFHIHQYKIPQDTTPSVVSPLIYISFSMKRETFTFFDDIFIMMSTDAIDSGVNPNQFVLCTNEDKTQAWIDWVVPGDDYYIDYTIISENSTGFHDPVMIYELNRCPVFVNANTTGNKYYAISGYDNSTSSKFHNKDHGFERYFFDNFLKTQMLYNRPPSYSHPIDTVYTTISNSDPENILKGPLGGDGGDWEMMKHYKEITKVVEDTNGAISDTSTLEYYTYNRNR